MELTAADVAGVPATNLHVPVAEFVALWAAAEAFSDQPAGAVADDWYIAGVVITCRWLARATSRPVSGPWYPARSPVTKRQNLAYEELIQAEAVAADVLEAKEPRPRWLLARPGWSEGIAATFRWAWLRTGPAPVELQQHATA